MKEEGQELKEPSPQPNLSSYYRFIEGGRVIPQIFPFPYSLNLKTRGQGHTGGMKIDK